MNTVAQIVQHLRPGGIETMALDLLDHRERDERAFIVSLEGDRASALSSWPRLRPYGDRLIFLDKRPGFKPSLIATLARLFKRGGVDAVHTHHIGPLIYGGLAARLAGVKRLVHTEHDAWHLTDRRRRSVQRLAIGLTRPTLVADAQTVAHGMRTYLKRDDMVVIPNGIDTERFKPGDRRLARTRLGLPEQARIVGCSGRLEPVKGQRVLIEALVLLPLDVHVALAGGGSEEEDLRRRVESLGLGRRVHFLGRIDDMPDFYQALDLFCLPSFHEGLPLSPLEAQACGIPAVVTSAGGAWEALCPDSGRLVNKGDAKQLAVALKEMLSCADRVDPRGFVERYGNVRKMARAYAALRNPGYSLGG